MTSKFVFFSKLMSQPENKDKNKQVTWSDLGFKNASSVTGRLRRVEKPLKELIHMENEDLASK